MPPTVPETFTSSVLPPHERGLELGRRFAGEVSATVGRYRRLFERVAEDPGFDVDDWSARAWQSISRLAPDHAEEIAGIAEGAGLAAEHVASVNARTELLVAANPSGVVTECSAVVSIAPGGSPVVVQTWDWYDAMSPGWFTWRIPHPDGRVVETVTEFGMLAKIGVNDRGVGVLLTMLRHRTDHDAVLRGEVGHPVHLLSRSILDDAGSTAEGVAIATGARTSASTSLTVVDATGEACSVELCPSGPGQVRPVDGLLVRTNHFLSDEGREGCLGSSIGVSTKLRRDHLADVLRAHRARTADDVLDAMTHHLPDGGVCRHPVVGTDPLLWHRTLATVAVDVEGCRLDVRPDGPCGRLARLERPGSGPASQEVARCRDGDRGESPLAAPVVNRPWRT